MMMTAEAPGDAKADGGRAAGHENGFAGLAELGSGQGNCGIWRSMDDPGECSA
jgi:hypothetical protein